MSHSEMILTSHETAAVVDIVVPAVVLPVAPRNRSVMCSCERPSGRATTDDNVTNLVVAQLLHLESENPDADVAIYINSPGGDMNGLFAIHDTMRYINPDVATICVGQAASAAAVLLAAGAPGKRYALPNARVLIHQPHGGAQGQSTDMELAVAEMVEMRRRMVDILVEATGQSAERITADIDRDYIVRGDQALAYGLVDHIVDRRQLPSATKAIAAA